MVRTPCFDPSGLRKGTWTPEEDRKLAAYVARYGCWNWRQLPKFAGLSRCGKSCRLRWLNYLRPNVKRGNYSKEEDELIVKLHESLGNRWSVIAAHLPGRTDNEIKNHWHTALKKHSNQTSNSDESKRNQKNHMRKMEHANSTTEDILETSHFSLENSSSNIRTSPKSADNAAEFANFFEDLDDFVSATVEEAAGNFWTETNLIDNYSITNFPASPLNREALLCTYKLYDEHFDTLW